MKNGPRWSNERAIAGRSQPSCSSYRPRSPRSLDRDAGEFRPTNPEFDFWLARARECADDQTVVASSTFSRGMRSTIALLPVCLLACRPGTTATDAPRLEESQTAEPVLVALPMTLTGTVVADDDSGRILIVGETTIAAFAESASAAPDFDAWEQVECDGLFACRVRANGCEGTISREPDATLVLAFAPGSSDDAQRCAAYSGRYLPHPEEEDAERIVPFADPDPSRPSARVVMGLPVSGDPVDIEKAKRYASYVVEDLERCYVDYLSEHDASTAGVVHVSVPPQGSPRIESSTLDAPTLERCVSGSFDGIARIRTKLGTPATVHYVASFVRY